MAGLLKRISDYASATLPVAQTAMVELELGAGTPNKMALSALPKDSGVTVVAIAAGVVATDASLGNFVTVAANGAMTSFTFSNLPGAGRGITIQMQITQDATGSRVATFPAAFKWAGGTPGVLSTAANAVDVLTITTFNQGTAWQASLAKAFA